MRYSWLACWRRFPTGLDYFCLLKPSEYANMLWNTLSTCFDSQHALTLITMMYQMRKKIARQYLGETENELSDMTAPQANSMCCFLSRLVSEWHSTDCRINNKYLLFPQIKACQQASAFGSTVSEGTVAGGTPSKEG